MSRRTYGVCATVVSSVLLLSACVGCTTSSGLPPTVTVELPDGTTQEVEIGAGVASLANSTWEFSQVYDTGQAVPFLTVIFDETGAMSRFENTQIPGVSALVGTTILFDDTRHNTTQAGVQYSAATYGAESSDASGFSFEGRVAAFAAGLQAANAEASATATYDPDDPDAVVGTFAFRSEVTLIDMPEGNQEDEFNFRGRRVTE